MRKIPTVVQATATDCGPAVLTALLKAYGRPVTLRGLCEELDPGRDGTSALLLKNTAKGFGVELSGHLIDPALLPETLPQLPVPLVLHLKRQHYVIIERVRGNRITLMDPAVGRRRVSLEHFSTEASGLVLLVSEEHDPETGTGQQRAGSAEASGAIKLLTALLKQARASLAAAAALSLLVAFGGLGLPIATALIVDALVTSGQEPARWLVLGILLAVALGAVTFLRNWCLAGLQVKMARHLSKDVAGALFSRTLRFFERRSVGDLFARIESAQHVHALLSMTLLGAGLDAILAIGYLIGMSLIAPQLALITGVMIGLCLAVSGWVGLRSAAKQREELLLAADASTAMVDGISGVSTLRSFGAENSTVGHWTELLERRLTVGRERATLGAVNLSVMTAAAVATPLVVLTLAASGNNAATSPGVALGLMALATATLAPVTSLATQLVQAAELKPLLERIQDIHAAPAAAVSGTRPASCRGELTLESVGFRHTKHGPQTLAGITATAPAGATVAIIGPTGCGKSTLAALMAGLHEPTQGRVLFDGMDLTELHPAWLREQIGVVLQDTWIPKGSLEHALRAGREQLTEAELWQGLRAAQLDRDIERLPMGLQTLVGSGGTGLSGGQRQRLALARALVGQPRVLILDEPTSALDVGTEAAIEQTLRGLKITRFIVTHRLSTAAIADQIWVMDQGQLVQVRAPEALAAANGWYADLLRKSRPERTALG